MSPTSPPLVLPLPPPAPEKDEPPTEEDEEPDTEDEQKTHGGQEENVVLVPLAQTGPVVGGVDDTGKINTLNLLVLLSLRRLQL